MATFVILLDETELLFLTLVGFTIVLKLFRGTLVNIKDGSRKINCKWLRSIVATIALWNDPLDFILIKMYILNLL